METVVGDVFLFGDSHVGTISNYRARNWAQLPSPARERLHPNFVDEGGLAQEMMMTVTPRGRILNPIMQKALHAAGLLNRYNGAFSCRGKTILFLFGFGETHLLGFHPSWSGYSLRGRRVAETDAFPDEIISEVIEHRLASLFELTNLLKAHGADIAMLSGPPPHRDNALIQKFRPDLTFIPAAEIRLGVFAALLQSFKRRTRDIDVPFIDLSGNFSDADGYLKEQFEGDGVHANDKYAAAYLEALYRRYSLVTS